MCYALEKIVSQQCKASPAVVVALNVAPCSAAKRVQCRARGLDRGQLREKVIHRAGLIQEARLARSHQLWDSGDCGCEHDTLHRHSFHQRYWGAFAVASQNYDISVAIESRQLHPRNLTEQADFFLQPKLIDQLLMFFPFPALACN